MVQAALYLTLHLKSISQIPSLKAIGIWETIFNLSLFTSLTKLLIDSFNFSITTKNNMKKPDGEKGQNVV